MQTIKSILNKCDDEYLALLNNRNTPLHNGFSPAQLSMGRKLKTRIPCHPEEFQHNLPDCNVLRRKDQVYRDKMKKNYNCSWANLVYHICKGHARDCPHHDPDVR